MVAFETCFNIHKDEVALNSILPDLEGFELLEKTEKVREHIPAECGTLRRRRARMLNKYWYYE